MSCVWYLVAYVAGLPFLKKIKTTKNLYKEALIEHYVRSTRVPQHLVKRIQMQGMMMWVHHEQVV
jgi:hypothetical protein